MDCTVHGILQAEILEWVAIPFSRGSSQPRDQIQVSHIAGRFFTIEATREAQKKIGRCFMIFLSAASYFEMAKLGLIRKSGRKIQG